MSYRHLPLALPAGGAGDHPGVLALRGKRSASHGDLHLAVGERLDSFALVAGGVSQQSCSGNLDAGAGQPYRLQLVLAQIQEFVTGTRPAPHIDRMLVTVLFTDIVESTKFASEVGDARWKELLSQHHERAQAAVEQYHGRLIDCADPQPLFDAADRMTARRGEEFTPTHRAVYKGLFDRGANHRRTVVHESELRRLRRG